MLAIVPKECCTNPFKVEHCTRPDNCCASTEYDLQKFQEIQAGIEMRLLVISDKEFLQQLEHPKINYAQPQRPANSWK